MASYQTIAKVCLAHSSFDVPLYWFHKVRDTYPCWVW